MSVDPKGLEAFRAWYRNWTGKMLTRANAEKAIEAYLAATSPAGDLVEQKPVAWRYSSGHRSGDWLVTTNRELAYREHEARNLVEPLYTSQALRHQSTGVTGITDEMVERAAHARIPGGSEVWHWIAGGGMQIEEIHRAILHAAITAALSAQERE